MAILLGRLAESGLAKPACNGSNLLLLLRVVLARADEDEDETLGRLGLSSKLICTL